MSEKTYVYLITGFLGSGKTTFLNRIIDRFPEEKKLMILMNEFGEIGVDGTLIEGEDIDMMEISKGSIFCVCVKTDFIKGLYELSTTVRPDVLLIESTGVANPSDLKKDLQLPIFKERFQFTEQFCLIDGAHFLDAYGAFASLEKQIASSTVFIINKVDLSSAETIEQIKEVVREFHPDPSFFETTFADIPIEHFIESVIDSELQEGALQDADSAEFGHVLSDDELEKFVEDLLDSPELQMTPPDLLMSVAYKWRGDDLDEIESMAQHLPAKLIRAKGFLQNQGKTYLFNFVMGDWTLEESTISEDRIEHKNVMVFIGSPETIEAIAGVLNANHWTNLGEYQPFQQSS